MKMSDKKLYLEIPDSLTPEQLKMMCALEADAFPDDGAIDEVLLVPVARNGRLIWLREEGDERPVAVCELLRDYKEPNIAYIFGYYVRSDKQGKGYGKVFFEYLFERMQQDGFTKSCLTVKPSNLAAVKLYEKLGYHIEETRVAEYGEGSDRYYMVKSF